MNDRDELDIIWDWFLRHRFAVPLRREDGYEQSKQRALADLRRRLEVQRELPLFEDSA